MERLICIIIGYVFGLFQTSYIYGRLHGIDIRKCGSGNAGTTNMLRTLGTKAGAITLLGDAFKCVIAVLVVRMLFAGNIVKQPCFDEMRASGKGYRVVGDLAVTDRIMKDTFWLGVYPGMTDEKIDYMAKVIKEALQ